MWQLLSLRTLGNTVISLSSKENSCINFHATICQEFFFKSFYSLFPPFISADMVSMLIIRREDLDVRRRRLLTTRERERFLVLPLMLLRSWKHPCVFHTSQSPELAVREMPEHAFLSSCPDSYSKN